MPTLKYADKAPVTFAVEDLSDSQVSALLSAALTAKWGQGAMLQYVNRAKSSLTYDLYAMCSDGCRDWGTAAQLHQVTFEIGDNYEVTFGTPVAVMPVTTYEPVSTDVGGTGDNYYFSLIDGEGDAPLRARFSVTSADRYEHNGFAVYPKSLLFRAGDYPDKQFSMSTAELEAAAGIINGSREPIAGNVQHTQFLSGKAAFVDKAWTEEGGSVLRGVVRIPLGLDELMTDGDKGISMEWARAGKVAEGFALCTNPRVTDAALMALDAPVSAGEETPTETPAAAPTAAEEEIHLATTERRHGFIGHLKSLFTRFGITDEDVVTLDAFPPSAGPSTAGPAIEESPEIARLRSDLARSEAKQFVSDELRAGRCTPAEREGLIAAFTLAFEDDRKSPTSVTFTAGQGVTRTGNRVEALKARQALRPANQLTEELMQNSVVLTSDASQDNPEANAQFASLSTTYDRRRAAMSGAAAQS